MIALCVRQLRRRAIEPARAAMLHPLCTGDESARETLENMSLVQYFVSTCPCSFED